jgi:hypothetical protein
VLATATACSSSGRVTLGGASPAPAGEPAVTAPGGAGGATALAKDLRCTGIQPMPPGANGPGARIASAARCTLNGSPIFLVSFARPADVPNGMSMFASMAGTHTVYVDQGPNWLGFGGGEGGRTGAEAIAAELGGTVKVASVH